MRRRPGRPLVIAAAAVTFVLNAGCGNLPDDGGAGPVVIATAAEAPQVPVPDEAPPREAIPPAGGTVPAGTGIDPCTVLTAADVTGVLGQPVDLVNDLHGCDYLTRGQPATMVGVAVSHLAGGTAAEFEQLVEASAGALPGGSTWPVGGLGEAATAVAGAEDVLLYVKVADVYLEFSVIDPSGNPEASLAVLQRIALDAVPRVETAARG